MEKETRFEDLEITIPAGASHPFDTVCNSVALLESTGNNGDIKIAINNQTKQVFRKGLTFEAEFGQYFTKFNIFNASSSDITIVLATAIGKIRDSRLNFADSLIIKQGDTIEDDDPVTITTTKTKIVDSNTNEAWRAIFNSGQNTCYIGGSGIDAATNKGFPLKAGACKEYSLGAEIYAQCSNGSTILNIQRG